MRFYLSLTCDECENEVYVGVVITLHEHRGLPVVPIDVFTQETFVCDHCGTRHDTGDVNVWIERQSESTNDGDEDDGDD